MNKQAGFTLIEIIAVLVILGILAAVAIPKYQSLQEQAEVNAAKGVVAGGMSALTMEYSRLLLANDGAQPAATDVDDACGNVQVTSGWNLGCTGSGNTITVTATGPNGGTWNQTWNMP